MRTAIPFVALLLAIVGVAVTRAAPPRTSPRPAQVFVLAGQSNMVGQGQPLSLAAPTDPRLLLWRDGKWQVATDPLGSPDLRRRGVGPGMIFGLQVLKRQPGETIGLIMCAKNGSSISEWQPGEDLYQRCIQAARAAATPVAGILFLQGEDEAHKDAATAAGWSDRFLRVLAGFRADLGERVPFLLGQIGRLPPEWAEQQVVRDEQARIAATTPGVRLVRTFDLPVFDAHFTVAGYRILGARFATAWWRMKTPEAANG
jgi:hypothetical protein